MAISSFKLFLMGSLVELQSKLRSMSVSKDLRAMTVMMQLIRENRGVTFSRRFLVISSRGVSKLPII